LVPHPSDHSGFGPLLNWNPLRASNGAASYRRGMIADGTSESVGEIGVALVEAEEFQKRPVKIFNVLGLGLLSASGVCFLPIGEALRGSLRLEFGPNPLNGRSRCPHAP
jgi:hypothetical protein